VLQVDDSVVALQRLAGAYRDVLRAGGCKVVAVCGSNGKTTTRHLIHQVLTACGLAGTQSPKSFNNHLGVPLTLLGADPSHDFVAAEIGTNHPGEVAALSAIVRPDAAVITSIGHEHMAFFKTLDGVAQEEAAVLRFVQPHGYVVMPAAAAELLAAYYDVQEGVFLLPLKDAQAVPPGFGLPGQHNRMNAALVVALARWLELDAQAVARALESVEGPPGRMQRLTLGQGVTVLHDAYNANPDSMQAALAVMSQQPGRRVAVLGEMYELGPESPTMHQQVAHDAQQTLDQVILIGELFGAPPWSDELPGRVASELQPGDTVLLKASRGMRLERLLPAIEQRFAPA